MKKIILVGGGGHCKSCIDVIEKGREYGIAGIIDLPEKQDGSVLGYPVIGTDEDIGRLAAEHPIFLVTAGQIKSAALRKRLFAAIRSAGGRCPVVVSPLAYVSPHARIGEGTVVMHHAVVNAAAVVGRNSIINTRALVEHDAVIGDHCHIATGSIINGGVVVGAETFWGSGAASREYVRIGKKSVVGCHATVKSDLPPGTTLK